MKNKIGMIISCIALVIFTIVSTFTMYLTINYISGEAPTEGSGIMVALIYVVSSFHIILMLVFSSVAYCFIRLKSKKFGESRKNLYPFVLILLAVLIFIIQDILLKVI